MASTEPQITKHLVVMKNARMGPDGVTINEEVRDYVREDFLEAYIADASTRWEFVSDEGLDAGPAGYHGETHIPAGLLGVPDAGITVPSTYHLQED